MGGNAVFTNFEKMIDVLIDSQLPSNLKYKELVKKDPLKSAVQLKEQHKEDLKTFLRIEETNRKLHRATELILERLPQMLSEQEWKRTVEEFEASIQTSFPAHASKRRKFNPDLLFQNIFGISNPTLNHLYHLGKKLIEEAQYANAECLFTLLQFLNPYICEFWIGSSMALFFTEQYELALNGFEIAHLLETDKATPLIYCALCNIKLNKTAIAKECLQQLDRIFKQNNREQQEWGDVYAEINNQL